MPREHNQNYEHNTEEIQDLIGSPPSWIIRRGIAVVFLVVICIMVLASVIEYPDVVKATLKVTTLNSPTPVLSRQSGKLISILKREGAEVQSGEHLAYIESTARHSEVLELEKALLDIQARIQNGSDLPLSELLSKQWHIGELQGSYQGFYQSALDYRNTLKGGNAGLQRRYMEQELMNINKLRHHLEAQRQLQISEAENAEDEFKFYSQMAEKGVISRLEFKHQQGRYNNSKLPLQQTDATLLNNSASYQAKQKEILDHLHRETQLKQQFSQSLNSMITNIDEWKQKYIVRAPVLGVVTFSGLLQENQNIEPGQELFVVNPGSTEFFGEVKIPQYNMGKIREGQRALVKLKSFPFEEYGLIRGTVGYLADVAYRDSIFVAKVEFEQFEGRENSKLIKLKSGMLADAEIITEESTLLQRLTRNIRKMMNTN